MYASALWSLLPIQGPYFRLREACAKARIVRGRISDVDGTTVGRSRSTATMDDLSPPLTPSEKTKRRESSSGRAETEMVSQIDIRDLHTFSSPTYSFHLLLV